VAIKKFIKQFTNMRETYAKDFIALQDKLQEVLDQFTDNPISDNFIIEDIDVDTTTVLVEHRLGRAVRGWYIIDSDAASAVFRDTSSEADPILFLALKAFSAATISIVVF